MIQLVNAGGTHTDASVASDDYIPPILDITLSLSLKNEPEALILQPQGRELMFTKEADGSFTPITSLAQLDGIRYYPENNAFGGAEYWLESRYVAKRGVRLIQPE